MTASAAGHAFGPLGSCAVVKELLRAFPVAVAFGRRLVSLESVAGGGWRACGGDGATAAFDAVVLAMPPGDAQRVVKRLENASVRAAVQKAERAAAWRSRFALALWWRRDDLHQVDAFLEAVKTGAALPRSEDIAAVERQLNDDALGVALTIHSTEAFWRASRGVNAGGGTGGGRQQKGKQPRLFVLRSLGGKTRVSPPEYLSRGVFLGGGTRRRTECRPDARRRRPRGGARTAAREPAAPRAPGATNTSVLFTGEIPLFFFKHAPPQKRISDFGATI